MKAACLQKIGRMNWAPVLCHQELGRFAIKMSVKGIWGEFFTQSCLTLCTSDPMDYSPPGSSVHGISQARILEWVAIPFSGGSSRPRDQTHISCTSRQILYHWATRKAQLKETTDKKKIANIHFNEPITVYESGTLEYLKDWYKSPYENKNEKTVKFWLNSK